MTPGTPRLDGLDPERIAELAAKMLRTGEEDTRTDLQISAFTQASAFAAMGILAEVHKMRLALDDLVKDQRP
jgi:hypothetical protein